MKQTFEEFVEEIFSNQREIGGMAITKDNYESLSDSWWANLDITDMLDYGQMFASKCYQQGINDTLEDLNKSL